MIDARAEERRDRRAQPAVLRVARTEG
jgi:hypothetical protein